MDLNKVLQGINASAPKGAKLEIKAQHTPGPWSNDHGVEISSGQISICGMRFPFNDDPEKAANARLIAAAPELLEACKEVLEFLEYLRPVENQHWNNVLKSAIAKAEGR